MSDEKHVYDGIIEENNPMPMWWIWMFIFTVIFGFIYWLHYEFGGGPSLQDEYAEQLAVYEKQVELNTETEVVTEESLATYAKSETVLASGALLFAEKCAVCHGANLEGKIGPNLTDHFWLNGDGGHVGIYNVISKGSLAKGMPAWSSMLKPTELKNLTAFVHSKIGSNPQSAKAPEGVEFK